MTKGEVQFTYCPTENVCADILTKPLAAIKNEKKKIANEIVVIIKHYVKF